MNGVASVKVRNDASGTLSCVVADVLARRLACVTYIKGLAVIITKRETNSAWFGFLLKRNQAHWTEGIFVLLII